MLPSKVYARMLSKCLSKAAVAEVLDGLLDRDENESLSHREWMAASLLFDSLSDACPDAVEIASCGRLVHSGRSPEVAEAAEYAI